MRTFADFAYLNLIHLILETENYITILKMEISRTKKMNLIVFYYDDFTFSHTILAHSTKIKYLLNKMEDRRDPSYDLVFL